MKVPCVIYCGLTQMIGGAVASANEEQLGQVWAMVIRFLAEGKLSSIQQQMMQHQGK